MEPPHEREVQVNQLLLRYQGAVAGAAAVYRPAGIGALRHLPPFMLGVCHYALDVDTLVGLEAHRSAAAELTARLAELDKEAEGRPFTDAQRTEFEEISAPETGLLARVSGAIEELEIRENVVKQVVAAGGRGTESPIFAVPNIRKAPENVFDLAAYRQRASSLDELPRLYIDGAKHVLEQAIFPTVEDKAKAQGAIEKLLVPSRHRDAGAVARHMIGTGSPQYAEAWGRYVTSGPGALTHGMQAALQTYSDADGGFAIPFTIDPTFVLTSDGSVNPLREISRKETITTKEWQAVTTGGVTATYATETTSATDSAPSDVGNPTITPVRAHSFVKFTAEYQEDYGSAAIASELGSLIQVAKDDLEADKFFMGSGTNEPDGIVARLITDTTSIVTTITDNVFALADIDKLIGQLPPRFRSRAKMTANLAILQLLPAFGTAGQPGNSIYDPLAKTVRGYPVFEASAMDDVATDAKEIILMGDFAHFVIVDRLGLSAEYVPQVFDGDGKPLGQRGIYARWRNDTGILTVNAFRLLKVQ